MIENESGASAWPAPPGVEVAARGSGDVVGAVEDPFVRFTEEWLTNRRLSENTRAAYRLDVHRWGAWCAEHGLDPLRARFQDVNAWGREMERPPDGSRPAAATTVARRMSAVSSWYNFLVKLGAIEANPAAIADRPYVDRDYSATVAFTHADATAMLVYVSERGDPYVGDACAKLLAAWLIEMGTRVGETIALDIADLGHSEGYRIAELRVKGGKRKRRAIPPTLAHLLDVYLTGRAAAAGIEVAELDGALFVDRAGNRLDRFEVYRFVRRLARGAQIPNADKITPHSFRHAWNTMARAEGADLESRQDALGHKDPRTTRRYDRTSGSLARDPAFLVSAAVFPHTPEKE